MPRTDVLRVEGLGKRYGSRWVFRGLSFQLETGDRLLVTGRNGAGKSTLLKTIAGLLAPSAGTVELPDGDSRIAVGLSALEQALYPQLTLLEHLKFAADLRGCPAREEELLDLIGLGYARNFPASQLSTGMKGRLKLALAIQAKPKLLLLDEPGAGLDEAGRALVETIAIDQATRGSLVLATNDPAEGRLANIELALEG
jgi:ABC-type multidrug transport system ATPase subunit